MFKSCPSGISFDLQTKKKIMLMVKGKVSLAPGPQCTLPRNSAFVINKQLVAKPVILVSIEKDRRNAFAVAVENFAVCNVTILR